MPTVALVGYTNAGKSTLLNALTGADVSVENRLFATLDPTTRCGSSTTGKRYLVTDTVGFIRGLPTQLVQGFRRRSRRRSTPTSSSTSSTPRRQDRYEAQPAVSAVLHDIGAGDLPSCSCSTRSTLSTRCREPAATQRIGRVDLVDHHFER